MASHLEISAAALRSNVAVFRSIVGAGRRVGVVLKGNAYGHGFSEVLPIAHQVADVLYVVTPGEALAVRAYERASQRSQRSVLVIGAVSAEEWVELARQNVEVVVADPSFRRAVPLLRSAEVAARIHLHIDTGLGREGFTLDQLRSGAADALGHAKDVLQVNGVLSHFANTEDVTEQSYAQTQLHAFDASAVVLSQRGLIPAAVQRHFAASAAALVLPPSRLDVVRIGIGFYGFWPSTETRLSAKVILPQLPTLTPALSWRCPSQAVKWLSAGSYVGYGCTWRCNADTKVAVLPVGYWDGYPRLASGKAHVLVNGRRCQVLGRVMMNHLIIDVTHASSTEEPILATLLGHDGDEQVTAEMLAAWSQTIHYEVVTRLGAHLSRRVMES
jgi:alanine racemase